MKKVAFCTLGCKVNQYETDVMEKDFKNAGYEIVDFDDISDIYVINSCSVTNLATRKSRQMASKAKKNNNSSIVVLAGCYSEEVKNTDSLDMLTGIDLVIGNEEKKNIVSVIENFKSSKHSKVVMKLADISKVKRYAQNTILDKGKNIRESIKIEDGCNNFCTYCIIPYTRGRIRSRSLESIVEEVKQITKNGVKEIVLVGIEIASYGKDLDTNIYLIDVIDAISKIDGVKRIRLGSIEPRWLTDENIIRLSKISKLCNHFHISVQSMSNSVLKRMNRKYTAEYVIDRINMLRKYFKNPGITCDVIVGFINETDDEFNETLENIQKVKFSDMHVFKFSKRKGTAAYNMQNSVTGEVANKRSNILIQVAKENKTEFEKKFIGKTLKVLFDEEKDGKLYGYTDNYIKIRGEGENILWGEIQDLEFYSIEENILIGKIKPN